MFTHYNRVVKCQNNLDMLNGSQRLLNNKVNVIRKMSCADAITYFGDVLQAMLWIKPNMTERGYDKSRNMGAV